LGSGAGRERLRLILQTALRHENYSSGPQNSG
jgi:hypothetical protein